VVVEAGVTVMDAPVLAPEAGVVQPAFVNHFHEAPVPRNPPVTLSVEEAPAFIFAGVTDAPAGAVDAVSTLTMMEEIVVLPQVPSPRT
jgi:hypothetical protein